MAWPLAWCVKLMHMSGRYRVRLPLPETTCYLLLTIGSTGTVSAADSMATGATGGLVLEQVRVSGLVWGPQLQRRADADPAAVANVCLAFRYESKHIASGNHHQHSPLPPDGSRTAPANLACVWCTW